MTPAEQDTVEALVARDRPQSQQRQHALGCRCHGCVVEWHYSPGDGDW